MLPTCGPGADSPCVWQFMENDMATVTVQRSWPDGDVLTVEIEIENDYPDALAEAKRTALNAYEEALLATVALGDDDEEAGE